MAGGLADILFAPAGVPEMSSTPPLDGQDFTTVGGQGTELGGSPIYFPQGGPDPVLADLRAAYEKQQGIPQQPSMAGMSLAHAEAMQAPQPQEQAPAPAPATTPPGGTTAEQEVLAQATAQANLETQAARREAALEGEAATRRAGVQDAYRVEQERVEFERQSAVNAQTERVRQVTDEARNTKINPSRYMKNTNAFGHLADLFAVALGGSMRGVSGGHNYALESIDKRIAQDIAAQEADLDNLNKSVGYERTILGDLREQFQDKAAARAAMHIIALDQVTNDFNAKLAGVKDLKAQARGAELLMGVAEKRRGYEIDADAAVTKATQQRFENKMAQGRLNVDRGQLQLGQDRLVEDRRQADEAQATARSKAGLDFLANLTKTAADAEAARGAASVNGGAGAIDTNTVLGVQMDGEAPDSKTDRVTFKDGTNATAVAKVRELVSTAHNVSDLVGDIKELGTNKNLVPDERKALANSAMAGIRLTKQALIRGAPSDSDQKIVDKAAVITDPQAFLTFLDEGENRRVLEYLADSTTRETNTQLRPYGVRLAPRAARPLTGQGTPKERNPAAKTAAARAASAEFRPGDPERIGDTAFAPSAKMEEYINISKSTVSNYKSLGEMKAHRKEIANDVHSLGEAKAKEKDPQRRAELTAAQTAAFIAMTRLDDLLAYQKEGSKRNKDMTGAFPGTKPAWLAPDVLDE